MSPLKQITLVALTVVAPYLFAAPARADIYRWDTGQVIPGTEGIEPGPGVNLSSWNGEWNTESQNLRFADFSGGLNLAGADFYASWLDNANLSGANLRYATLQRSTLTNANLSGATVTEANFFDTTSRGFTATQLYSTKSYKAKDLQGIGLMSNDLTGWDFSGQDLRHAVFGQFFQIGLPHGSDLSGANLRAADLRDASLTVSDLTGADFSGAVVTGTQLTSNFSSAQLYSTQSYAAKDIHEIGLFYNNLSGWDFSGQNLTLADLSFSDLNDANLMDANLTSVYLAHATLINANLTGTDLRGAVGWSGEGLLGNTIQPDGVILGLVLADHQLLAVYDHDGVPDPAPVWPRPGWWQSPRDPIPVTVHDKMAILHGGVMELVFNGSDWGSTIKFQDGVPVQLGGTLELTFTDDTDLASQVGRTLHVFDWTGVSPTGTFTVDSDYLWDLSNLYTSGEITLVSTLPGDTNGDGQIGLEDLNNVRNNFGETGAPGLPGDAIPFDGIVDLGDLNAVRNNFGAVQTAAASVPEPSGRMLAMATCLAASLTRRRTLRIGQGCFAICVAVLCADLASRPAQAGFRVGPEINVSPFGFFPKWSSDSTKIVFNNCTSDVIPSGDAGTDT